METAKRDRLAGQLAAIEHELEGYTRRLAAVKGGQEDPSVRVFGTRDPQFAIGAEKLKERIADTKAALARTKRELDTEIERLKQEMAAALLG